MHTYIMQAWFVLSDQCSSTLFFSTLYSVTLAASLLHAITKDEVNEEGDCRKDKVQNYTLRAYLFFCSRALGNIVQPSFSHMGSNCVFFYFLGA